MSFLAALTLLWLVLHIADKAMSQQSTLTAEGEVTWFNKRKENRHSLIHNQKIHTKGGSHCASLLAPLPFTSQNILSCNSCIIIRLWLNEGCMLRLLFTIITIFTYIPGAKLKKLYQLYFEILFEIHWAQQCERSPELFRSKMTHALVDWIEW